MSIKKKVRCGNVCLFDMENNRTACLSYWRRVFYCLGGKLSKITECSVFCSRSVSNCKREIPFLGKNTIKPFLSDNGCAIITVAATVANRETDITF